MITTDEAAAMLARPDDELWRALGEALEPSRGARRTPSHTLIANAKQWLRDHYSSLKQEICHNPVIKRLVDDRTSDDVAICVGLTTVITNTPNVYVTVAVAVLIAKRGCGAFCAESVPAS